MGANGRFFDQPALNYTLRSMEGFHFHLLDHCWNAKLRHTPNGSSTALIWHLYFSSTMRPNDLFGLCCQNLRADRPIYPKSRSVMRLVRSDEPDYVPLPSPFWKRKLKAIQKRLLRS